MAPSVLFITLAAFCVVQYVYACDKATVDKVKALSVKIDPEQMEGDYFFSYVYVGDSSDELNGECLSAKFYGGKVDFNGLAKGKYDTVVKDNKMDFLSNGDVQWEAYMLYATKSAIGFVTCSPSDIESKSFAFSGVAVRKDSGEKGLADSKEAIEKLASVGINKGVTLSACKEN